MGDDILISRYSDGRYESIVVLPNGHQDTGVRQIVPARVGRTALFISFEVHFEQIADFVYIGYPNGIRLSATCPNPAFTPPPKMFQYLFTDADHPGIIEREVTIDQGDASNYNLSITEVFCSCGTPDLRLQ